MPYPLPKSFQNHSRRHHFQKKSWGGLPEPPAALRVSIREPRYICQIKFFHHKFWVLKYFVSFGYLCILMISGGWWQPFYYIIKVYVGGHVGFNGNVMVKSHH